jgi:hypothetical protein
MMALNFDYGLTDSTLCSMCILSNTKRRFLGKFDLTRSVPKRSVRMNSNPSPLALGTAVVHLLGGVQEHHRLEHVGQLLNQGLKPKKKRKPITTDLSLVQRIRIGIRILVIFCAY